MVSGCPSLAIILKRDQYLCLNYTVRQCAPKQYSSPYFPEKLADADNHIVFPLSRQI